MVSRRRSLAALAWLAAPLLACATAPPPRPSPVPPPRAVEAVDRELESRALLLLLADREVYEPRSLETLLGGTPPVRRALAAALGRIGDARGRALLQGLLIDGDLEVRREAAFALGQLGAPEAGRALLVAAVDEDEGLGSLAVEALGKLGAPLADVRRALGALETGSARRRLAWSLFRFREPARVEAARELLISDDPEIRRAAAYALGREALPEGRTALRSLLADPDPFVRALAARGTGEVGGLEDLESLAALLAAREVSPRVQALRAGARILDRVEALPPLVWGDRVSALARDEAPGVRAAALEAAGSFLPHPALEAELRRAWAEGEPRERELALAALASPRVADAAALVAEAARSPSRLLRARAAEAAGRLGDRELVAALLADREPQVRAAALAAAAELGDLEPLLAALADRDPTVRATALDALAEEPALATERVVAAIDAARADGAQNDVRLAGVQALVARGSADGARERAPVLAALERLAADGDWLVRRAAADGLAELGAPRPEIGPARTDRDLATYREIVRQTARPLRVEMTTERGRMVLELACPEAPLTCLSFVQLARQGYFDGLAFHRVVPDFVVQGGDPRGDGSGGPGYALRDEINRLRYRRGTLGMALSGPDTGGSQFFLTLAPQPHLDGAYTVFGRLVSGDETLDRIRQGDRILTVREGPGAVR